jgi:hypothetical protein
LLVYFWKSENGFFGFFGGLASAIGGLFSGGSILGSIAKTAGSALIGGAINRFNKKEEYKDRRDEGFTHSEIAGAGGMHGNSDATAVMGNQATQFEAQRRQMEFEHTQRELDRVVMMRGQDAGVQQAQVSAGASMYGANVQQQIAAAQQALANRQFDEATLPKALNDIATSTPDWKRQQLLASMGVDNMIATAIAGARGIDIMDPDILARMSASEFNDLMVQIYGLQSTIFRETAGSSTIINNGVQALGNDARSFKDWLFGSDQPMMSRPTVGPAGPQR